MELSRIKKGIRDFLTKNKYAIAVLVIGLLLMIMPGFRSDTEKDAVVLESTEEAVSAEEKLAGILSQIKGAGEVTVMLMESAGEEIIYQTNSSINTDNTKYDTVTVTDENRNQSGLIRQVKSPQYSGAIIVCSGADDPNIHLAIVDAVSKVTGLGANRISVLKRK